MQIQQALPASVEKFWVIYNQAHWCKKTPVKYAYVTTCASNICTNLELIEVLYSGLHWNIAYDYDSTM